MSLHSRRAFFKLAVQGVVQECVYRVGVLPELAEPDEGANNRSKEQLTWVSLGRWSMFAPGTKTEKIVEGHTILIESNYKGVWAKKALHTTGIALRLSSNGILEGNLAEEWSSRLLLLHSSGQAFEDLEKQENEHE